MKTHCFFESDAAKEVSDRQTAILVSLQEKREYKRVRYVLRVCAYARDADMLNLCENNARCLQHAMSLSYNVVGITRLILCAAIASWTPEEVLSWLDLVDFPQLKVNLFLPKFRGKKLNQTDTPAESV
jgi:hypothetical protein